MKKVIIIGAGMAGLAAGIYACKNGYEATIYESHFLPGGMCTAWQRQGFMFEGCLHFLGIVGCSPAHVFFRLWRDLGALPETKMIQHEIFQTFKDKDGRTLNFYTDASKLEKELLAISPADAKEIRALCTTIKLYSCFVRTSKKNPFRFIANFTGILRAIPLLKKYGSMNLADYAARFTDPLIQFAFTNIFIYPNFSSIALFFLLAGMHIKATGFPQGGSLLFVQTIERTFLQLNGKIEYKNTVKKILVEDGRAVGIELDEGSVEYADVIISAADGHATLFDMLDDKFTTPSLREWYAIETVFPPFIQVSLGVNRDMSNTPHMIRMQISDPIVIAGKQQQTLWYHHLAFDPTMAPEGKTSITVLYPSDIGWWENLGYRSEEYEAEKRKILEITIEQLEQVLPGISSQVETSDVATPITWFRYTHNWKGALGFMMTNDMAASMMKPKYTLPGLDNFYMIGQWQRGFGVPTAIMSAKDVLQKICKADHKKFRK